MSAIVYEIDLSIGPNRLFNAFKDTVELYIDELIIGPFGERERERERDGLLQFTLKRSKVFLQTQVFEGQSALISVAPS